MAENKSINEAVLGELLKGKDSSQFEEVFKQLKKEIVERCKANSRIT